MDISKMKQKLVQGPEDGSIFALIKDKIAYLVTAHGMEEAKHRLAMMNVARADRWLPSNNKAVLIPGIWEYEMATYQETV